jgi:hypothetical protein
MISRTERERMKGVIDKLDPSEHRQILTIVRRFTDVMTTTDTGVFVSTDNLTDECLQEIQAYLIFSADQRKRMEEDAKERKTYERMVHR